MALKLPPMLLHQTCTVRSSQIPHILTALAIKHTPTRAPLGSKGHKSTQSHALPSSISPAQPNANTSTGLPPSATPRDKRAIYIASLFGFSLALYLSFVYVGVRRDLANPKRLAQDADVSDRWDSIGRRYDDEIDLAEKVMFMGRKRRRVVSQATGEVLEVSVGTGRNMLYYNLRPLSRTEKKEQGKGRVTGLVFNDKAGVMVDAARKKFQQMDQAEAAPQRFQGRVGFVVGDAGAEGVIQRPGAGFDTIVQTMGLCSTNDPVGLLKRLGELCRKPTEEGRHVSVDGGGGLKKEGKAAKGKEGNDVIKDKGDEYNGGRILLLEHGHGHYDWLNTMLDGLAPAHADHYGCWWNRDIGAIVEQSGLEVERIRRYHLGTTWEVILRPKREQEKAATATADSSKQNNKTKNGGIFGWLSKGPH